MNEIERKILAARLSGFSFSELNESEQRFSIDQIMFRGAAICGCVLPHTEMFAKFIAEEISGFIENFGYGEFTLEEILLSLRLNLLGGIKNAAGNDLEQIVFSGNCINVFYLAKIFKNYKVLRDNLDSRIKNKIDGY